MAAVKKFALANPEKDWIVGGTYDRTLGINGTFDAAWLDAAVADRPIVLHAADHHTIWVNSEAMRRAGVTRATPDCITGIIERFSDGEPRGTFREWDATNLILSKVPPRSLADEIDALGAASMRMAASGITWWQDAWIDPGMAEIYLATSKAGALKQDVDLAFRADPNTWEADLKYFLAMREEIANADIPNRITCRTIKFFTDGIVEGGTALLLEPYLDEPQYHGMPVWGREQLFKAVNQADAAGFQLHIHAIGDGGVRLALDAIENVIMVNPPRDRRPVVAHIQLLTEEDLPRFAFLGVIANFTPVWTCLDSEQDVLCTPRIGQVRSDQQYRMRSLLDSGARLSFGSDWPVSTPSPFEGLPTAVHRRNAKGEPAEGWLMHEAITLDEALAAYTSGVAFQAGYENEWGSLADGMSANFLVLAQDPRQTAIDQIANLAIEATYLRGQAIFQRR
ncbi:N-substituted formamide deformylase precursor [mine drainage metagenome]|uniref:N-substituted formamide deformylase n=1 Tax=mine drainage metagenome TaxID=410659 RepID=A0A1J5Q6K1_9ZZZZ